MHLSKIALSIILAFSVKVLPGQAQEIVFGTNAQLATTVSGAHRSPELLITSDNNLHALWRMGSNGQATIQYLRSTLATSFLGESQVLTTEPGVAGVRLSLESSAESMVAGWTAYSGPSRAVVICQSSNRGQSWSQGLRANPVLDVLNAYQAAGIFPDGRVASMWLTYPSGHAPQMQWAAQENSSDFRPPIEVSVILDEGPCECCEPAQIILDDGLTVVVAYRNVTAESIRDVHILRSVDGGLSFPEVIRVDFSNWEIFGCPATGPSIAADGATVVLTWITAADGTSRVMQATSLDGGAQWAEAVEIAPQSAGPFRNHPRIAIRNQRAAIVWQEESFQTGQDVYAAWSNDGAISWSEGVPVSDDNDYTHQTRPVVAVASDETIVALWEDNREGNHRLFYASTTQEVAINDEVSRAPLSFVIHAHPNPFNPQTTLEVQTIAREHLSVVVFDLLGRLRLTVFDSEVGAGLKRIIFDGAGLESGVYIALARTESGTVATHKLLLLK